MAAEIWHIYLVGILLGGLGSAAVLWGTRGEWNYIIFAAILGGIMVAVSGVLTYQLGAKCDQAPKALADIRKRLNGHPSSRLDGDNGLVEATMREVDRLKTLTRQLPHTCTGNYADGTWRHCHRCRAEVD